MLKNGLRIKFPRKSSDNDLIININKYNKKYLSHLVREILLFLSLIKDNALQWEQMGQMGNGSNIAYFFDYCDNGGYFYMY